MTERLGFIRNIWLLSQFTMDLPFRSVDTPVEKRPRDATAKEPPRSTRGVRVRNQFIDTAFQYVLPILAMVPPWRMFRRFYQICRVRQAPRRQDRPLFVLVTLAQSRLTYSMLLLNVQLKVDQAGPGSCNTKL